LFKWITDGLKSIMSKPLRETAEVTTSRITPYEGTNTEPEPSAEVPENRIPNHASITIKTASFDVTSDAGKLALSEPSAVIVKGYHTRVTTYRFDAARAWGDPG
jgi:hypothetical protein